MEGRGILGGWVKLAKKLHSLGVVTPVEAKVGSSLVGERADKRGGDQVEVQDGRRTFDEVARAKFGRLGDAVWLQLGGRDLRSREEQLGSCLVGRWGEAIVEVPDLDLLRRWGCVIGT